MIFRPAFFFAVFATGVSLSQSLGGTFNPSNPSDWFRRAHDQMDLRAPGASPFHMKVTFHAYPGEELLSPGQKPQIMTGDGVYEET
jgi:hypothetical protein